MNPLLNNVRALIAELERCVDRSFELNKHYVSLTSRAQLLASLVKEDLEKMDKEAAEGMVRPQSGPSIPPLEKTSN